MTAPESPEVGPDPGADEVTDVVELRTPADVGYVSTLRLTAASLAARSDLTVDDIEDLRLAVDEACSLVLPLASAGAQFAARFEVGTGALRVHVGVATDGTTEPDRGGIAWTVLGALASEVDVRADDGTLTITVAKVREVLPQ